MFFNVYHLVKLIKPQTTEQEHERPAEELQPLKARVLLFEKAPQENSRQESIRRRLPAFPEVQKGSIYLDEGRYSAPAF